MKQQVSITFMLLGILFNVCLVASNLLGTKLINVFGISVTGGLMIFPISYIINDPLLLSGREKNILTLCLVWHLE